MFQTHRMYIERYSSIEINNLYILKLFNTASIKINEYLTNYTLLLKLISKSTLKNLKFLIQLQNTIDLQL